MTNGTTKVLFAADESGFSPNISESIKVAAVPLDIRSFPGYTIVPNISTDSSLIIKVGTERCYPFSTAANTIPGSPIFKATYFSGCIVRGTITGKAILTSRKGSNIIERRFIDGVQPAEIQASP